MYKDIASDSDLTSLQCCYRKEVANKMVRVNGEYDLWNCHKMWDKRILLQTLKQPKTMFVYPCISNLHFNNI